MSYSHSVGSKRPLGGCDSFLRIENVDACPATHGEFSKPTRTKSGSLTALITTHGGSGISTRISRSMSNLQLSGVSLSPGSCLGLTSNRVGGSACALGLSYATFNFMGLTFISVHGCRGNKMRKSKSTSNSHCSGSSHCKASAPAKIPPGSRFTILNVNWFGVSNPNKTCFSLKVNVGHGGRGSTTGMSKSISHSQSSSPRQSLGLRETGRRRISNFGFVGAQVSTPVSSSTVLYETRTKSSRDKLMRFTHGGLGTGINISKSISKRHSPDSSHSGGVSVFVIAKRLGRIQLVSAYAVTTLNVRTNMFGHGTRGIGTTISRSTSNTHSSSTVSHDAPPGGARLTIRNILLIGQPTGLSLK